MQSFNALEYNPDQISAKHPAGRFQVHITATETKPGKNNGDLMVVLTYQSNVGTQQQRFNIVNSAFPDNQAIARRQLSAVCHAVEVYNLNVAGNCRELLNKQLVIDIADQTGTEKLPDGSAKYSEVKMVYDIRGELPKARNAQTPQQQTGPQQGFAPPHQMAQQQFDQQAASRAYVQPTGPGQASQQFAYNGLPGQAQQGQPQAFQQPGMTTPPQVYAPSVGSPMPPMVNGSAPSFDPANAPQQPAWAAPR